MKIYLILALCSVASAVSLSFRDVIIGEWSEFKSKYAKNYTSEGEESFRMKVYLENRNKIAKHNQAAAKGLETFTLEMNEFGDLMLHEFVQMMNGYRNVSARPLKRAAATFLGPLNSGDLPKSVDWREKGYVTPVKNQGQCGSCWAFSATGSLEGQNFRKTGKLVSLSEQNLVDCSAGEGNMGCNGGLMDFAFAYIEENKGIDTEDSYPYEARDGKCRFSKAKVGATDTGFADIESCSEEKLTEAIATIGPISVAIDASSSKFQFYKSGVYYEKECSSESLDHGVLAVGYGTDDKGTDYYIVKNSWGTSWGDKGYILMSRNKNNNCGIASAASYPLI